MKNRMKVFWMFCVCAVASFADESVDVFGFQKFFETKAGSVSWTSEHWANGHERTFSDWSGDEEDPL